MAEWMRGPTGQARVIVIRLTVAILCNALLVDSNYKPFVAAEPQSLNLFFVNSAAVLDAEGLLTGRGG